MAREAQVHKPLLVQPLGGFLQQLDLLSVVLDEVIVSERMSAMRRWVSMGGICAIYADNLP